MTPADHASLSVAPTRDASSPRPSSATRVADSSSAQSDLFAVLPAVVLVGALYWPTFVRLARVWDTDPNYSHGFGVPLVSLLMIALTWKSTGSAVRQQVKSTTVLLGLVTIVIGLAFHLAAWFAGVLLFDVVSLVIVLRGSLLVIGGRQATNRFGFPVWFLLFMAPLPIAWYQPLAIGMQQLVSNICAHSLELCGLAVYREGYMLHIPGYSLEVGAACSGLRQLTAILALAVFIGYFSGRGSWYRWTLGLLSVPIAIAANCLRIMLTAAIMMLFGRQWAEGVFHSLEGLLLVGVASVMTLIAAWLLAMVAERHEEPASQRESPVPSMGEA